VAPIALNPDALLASVFVSATHPLEIVQATLRRSTRPPTRRGRACGSTHNGF
jgi:hypothetical protein